MPSDCGDSRIVVDEDDRPLRRANVSSDIEPIPVSIINDAYIRIIEGVVRSSSMARAWPESRLTRRADRRILQASAGAKRSPPHLNFAERRRTGHSRPIRRHWPPV
jgi:hypothetical protein